MVSKTRRKKFGVDAYSTMLRASHHWDDIAG